MFLYISIIALCWSVNPFIKKIINQNIHPLEYSIYNNTIIFLFFVVMGLVTNSYKKTISFDITEKLDQKQILLLMLSSFITLTPSYIMSFISKTTVLLL